MCEVGSPACQIECALSYCRPACVSYICIRNLLIFQILTEGLSVYRVSEVHLYIDRLSTVRPQGPK